MKPFFFLLKKKSFFIANWLFWADGFSSLWWVDALNVEAVFCEKKTNFFSNIILILFGWDKKWTFQIIITEVATFLRKKERKRKTKKRSKRKKKSKTRSKRKISSILPVFKLLSSYTWRKLHYKNDLKDFSRIYTKSIYLEHLNLKTRS